MPSEPTVAQRAALAGICAAGLLSAIAYGLSDPGFGGDSGKYLTVAQNLLQNGCISLSPPSSGECLPHWGGNQFPGYPALIALAALLSGASGSADPAAFVPGTIALQSLLLAVASFRTAIATTRFSGAFRAGLLTAVLVSFSPLHFAWSRWILTEAAATAAVLWIFAELLLSLHRRKLSILPLGLALAFAFFIRYDTLPICLAVALAAFMLHPPLQALRRGLLIALIMSLPVAGWTARNLAHGLSAMPQAEYGVGYLRGDGYYAWLATWTREFYEATLAAYPFAERKYARISIPQRVFDEPGGQMARELLARLAAIDGQALPAHFDPDFHALATERRAALPLQVGLINPALRAVNLWLSPAYSFGWKLELGTDAQRLVLTKGFEGALTLMQAKPVAVLGKAFIAGYRYLLTLAILILCGYAIFRPTTARTPLALAMAYCLGKTLFVTLLGQADPRLATQPYAVLEIVLLLYACDVLRRRVRPAAPGER